MGQPMSRPVYAIDLQLTYRPNRYARRPQPLPIYQALYDKALLPPREDRGTAYACSQAVIDETTHPSFTDHGTDEVGLKDAAREIVDHNDENRRPRPGTLEAKAIERLDRLFHLPSRALLGPDLIYKTFRDFDAVFYKSRLFGRTFGSTLALGPREAEIILNAEAIFNDLRPLPPDPYLQMFRTLLHEMAHGLEMVRNTSAGTSLTHNGHSPDCDMWCDVSIVGPSGLGGFGLSQ
ncbi:MAG: hypothetical protein Q9164_006069, partial [Protoblastenia rupestris]